MTRYTGHFYSPTFFEAAQGAAAAIDAAGGVASLDAVMHRPSPTVAVIPVGRALAAAAPAAPAAAVPAARIDINVVVGYVQAENAARAALNAMPEELSTNFNEKALADLRALRGHFASLRDLQVALNKSPELAHLLTDPPTTFNDDTKELWKFISELAEQQSPELQQILNDQEKFLASINAIYNYMNGTFTTTINDIITNHLRAKQDEICNLGSRAANPPLWQESVENDLIKQGVLGESFNQVQQLFDKFLPTPGGLLTLENTGIFHWSVPALVTLVKGVNERYDIIANRSVVSRFVSSVWSESRSNARAAQLQKVAAEYLPRSLSLTSKLEIAAAIDAIFADRAYTFTDEERDFWDVIKGKTTGLKTNILGLGIDELKEKVINSSVLPILAAVTQRYMYQKILACATAAGIDISAEWLQKFEVRYNGGAFVRSVGFFWDYVKAAPGTQNLKKAIGSPFVRANGLAEPMLVHKYIETRLAYHLLTELHKKFHDLREKAQVAAGRLGIDTATGNLWANAAPIKPWVWDYIKNLDLNALPVLTTDFTLGDFQAQVELLTVRFKLLQEQVERANELNTIRGRFVALEARANAEGNIVALERTAVAEGGDLETVRTYITKKDAENPHQAMQAALTLVEADATRLPLIKAQLAVAEIAYLRARYLALATYARESARIPLTDAAVIIANGTLRDYITQADDDIAGRADVRSPAALQAAIHFAEVVKQMDVAEIKLLRQRYQALITRATVQGVVLAELQATTVAPNEHLRAYIVQADERVAEGLLNAALIRAHDFPAVRDRLNRAANAIDTNIGANGVRVANLRDQYLSLQARVTSAGLNVADVSLLDETKMLYGSHSDILRYIKEMNDNTARGLRGAAAAQRDYFDNTERNLKRATVSFLRSYYQKLREDIRVSHLDESAYLPIDSVVGSNALRSYMQAADATAAADFLNDAVELAADFATVEKKLRDFDATLKAAIAPRAGGAAGPAPAAGIPAAPAAAAPGAAGIVAAAGPAIPGGIVILNAPQQRLSAGIRSDISTRDFQIRTRETYEYVPNNQLRLEQLKSLWKQFNALHASVRGMGSEARNALTRAFEHEEVIGAAGVAPGASNARRERILNAANLLIQQILLAAEPTTLVNTLKLDHTPDLSREDFEAALKLATNRVNSVFLLPAINVDARENNINNARKLAINSLRARMGLIKLTRIDDLSAPAAGATDVVATANLIIAQLRAGTDIVNLPDSLKYTAVAAADRLTVAQFQEAVALVIKHIVELESQVDNRDKLTSIYIQQLLLGLTGTASNEERDTPSLGVGQRGNMNYVLAHVADTMSLLYTEYQNEIKKEREDNFIRARLSQTQTDPFDVVEQRMKDGGISELGKLHKTLEAQVQDLNKGSKQSLDIFTRIREKSSQRIAEVHELKADAVISFTAAESLAELVYFAGGKMGNINAKNFRMYECRMGLFGQDPFSLIVRAAVGSPTRPAITISFDKTTTKLVDVFIKLAEVREQAQHDGFPLTIGEEAAVLDKMFERMVSEQLDLLDRKLSYLSGLPHHNAQARKGAQADVNEQKESVWELIERWHGLYATLSPAERTEMTSLTVLFNGAPAESYANFGAMHAAIKIPAPAVGAAEPPETTRRREVIDALAVAGRPCSTAMLGDMKAHYTGLRNSLG